MLLSSSAGQRASQRVLGLLENAKLRSAWLAALGPVYSSAYERGLERAGPPGSDHGEVIAECDLVDDTPLSPSAGVAPTLRIMLGGAELAMVRPRDGFWGPSSRLSRRRPGQISHSSEIAHRRSWIAAEDRTTRSSRRSKCSRSVDRASNDCARAEASIGFDGESVDVVFGIGVADDRRCNRCICTTAKLRRSSSGGAGVHRGAPELPRGHRRCHGERRALGRGRRRAGDHQCGAVAAASSAGAISTASGTDGDLTARAGRAWARGMRGSVGCENHRLGP